MAPHTPVSHSIRQRSFSVEIRSAYDASAAARRRRRASRRAQYGAADFHREAALPDAVAHRGVRRHRVYRAKPYEMVSALTLGLFIIGGLTLSPTVIPLAVLLVLINIVTAFRLDRDR